MKITFKKLALLATTIVTTTIMSMTAFAADRVSVHDPSIVKDGGKYYIFGSFLGAASSNDLLNWSTISSSKIIPNLDKSLSTHTDWAKYDANGGSYYNLGGNLWAPDVIYNTQMKKWCMYLSINGSDWNSSIALLTANNIEGPYTHAGTVVYSGFTNNGSDIKKHGWKCTDVPQVLGSSITSLPTRYNDTNHAKINAIDANVFYTEDGKLVMTYGSWSAGIYMLELDENTGLRDYNVSYKESKNDDDPYFGYKLAGGYYVSGEGPYIQYDKDTGYYYLYISYGNLEASGGYHVRVFRSKTYSGNYVDTEGRSAVYTSYSQITSPRGLKLFGNYNFSGLSGVNGYKAGGHNSILYDNDGKKYIVYHTRFNSGHEGHEVRVHQLYMSKDGWPVVSPYEYKGENISKSGYSKTDIVGRYQIVDHGTSATSIVSGFKVGMLSTKTIYLNADNTISGDSTGSWSVVSGSSDVKMTISGRAYTGKLVKQKRENSALKVMTFTIASNKNNCIWGVYNSIATKITSLTLKSSSISLGIKETYSNPATKVPSGSLEPVHYVSSNTNVARVSSSGVITAVAPGTAKIYARSTYGKEAVCTVTVKSGRPTSVKAKKSGTKNIKLTWKAGSGAVGYDVYRATSKKGSYKKIGTTTKRSYTDKTSKVGKNYFYRILSRGHKTLNTYNSPKTTAIKIIIPKKPARKSLKRLSKGFKLTIKKQSVTGYQVAYSTSRKFKSVKKKSSTKRVVTVTKLKSKKTYYVKVRAYNKLNGVKIYSKYSKVYRIKTK